MPQRASTPPIPLVADEFAPRLPVRWVQARLSGERIRIVLGPGGFAELHYAGSALTAYEEVRYAIQEYFRAQIAPDYFWRATFNRQEVGLLRQGALRPSRNHADGHVEPGLSVATHLGYVAMMGYPYGYRIRGRVIGMGSDGEPILDLATLEALDARPRPVAAIQAREGRAYHTRLRRVLAAHGWSWEQYRAAFYAEVIPAADYDARYGAAIPPGPRYMVPRGVE
jgi:hypothetical protein